jgi:hypothetical protein
MKKLKLGDNSGSWSGVVVKHYRRSLKLSLLLRRSPAPTARVTRKHARGLVLCNHPRPFAALVPYFASVLNSAKIQRTWTWPVLLAVGSVYEAGIMAISVEVMLVTVDY